MKTQTNRISQYIKPLKIKEYLLDLQVMEIQYEDKYNQEELFFNKMIDCSNGKEALMSNDRIEKILDVIGFNRELQERLKGVADG